jgi:hypothetical protein
VRERVEASLRTFARATHAPAEAAAAMTTALVKMRIFNARVNSTA